jgi:phosphoribosylformylglycinamidine cyclo-ligase
MANRMEINTDLQTAKAMIAISQNFNLEARIIGEVRGSDKKELTIESPHGTFHYE